MIESPTPDARRKPGRVQLTDRFIAGLKAPAAGRVDIADDQVRGLRIRVTTHGIKSWSVLVRQGRRVRRFHMGKYPEITLARAREEALELLPKARKGYDPIADRRRQTALREAQGVETFADLLSAYERLRVPELKRTRSWPATRRVIERVLKNVLRVPIQDVERSMVRNALDEKKAKAPVAARVAWEGLSPVLKWAEAREYLPEGFHRGLALAAPANARARRDRVLTDEEIRAVWPQLEEERYPKGRIYQLMLLTGQRLSEVAGMRWRELDLEAATWTIPAERSKSARSHTVPLSAAAVALLELAKRETRRKRELVFCTAGGKQLGNWHRTHSRILANSKTSGWTKHDLRRTVATRLAGLGVAPHVIEHVLGHADPLERSGLSRVASVYQHYTYEPEKRAALDMWATTLVDIIADESNVVPLVRPNAAA